MSLSLLVTCRSIWKKKKKKISPGFLDPLLPLPQHTASPPHHYSRFVMCPFSGDFLGFGERNWGSSLKNKAQTKRNPWVLDSGGVQQWSALTNLCTERNAYLRLWNVSGLKKQDASAVCRGAFVLATAGSPWRISPSGIHSRLTDCGKENIKLTIMINRATSGLDNQNKRPVAVGFLVKNWA